MRESRMFWSSTSTSKTPPAWSVASRCMHVSARPWQPGCVYGACAAQTRCKHTVCFVTMRKR